METTPVPDTWERGNPYEQYIGRWSRKIAPIFLGWLDAPPGARWLDVGCGTGALSSAILAQAAPASVVGVDPSEGFRDLAARELGGKARFVAGDAAALPLDDGACDVVVSGLVLNFVPSVPDALSEMRRVTSFGGVIAAYVWDYADGMEIIRRFWDAAASVDPAAARLHEGTRFPVCKPSALAALFDGAGLSDVETTSLDAVAEFADFEAYWRPFLGGQGPAPAYAMSLTEERRAALRDALKAALRPMVSGRISLRARAWAVRGAKRSDA